MREIFILLCIVGAIYFMFARRRFDFYSMAYAAALIYFMPGFFGYANYPFAYKLMIAEPLVKPVYTIMILVVFGILAAAFFFDLWDANKEKRNLKGSISIRAIHFPTHDRLRFAPEVLLAVTFLSFVLLLATVGSTLFEADKSLILEDLNQSYLIFKYSVSLGVLTSYLYKKRVLMLLQLCFLLFDLYTGFRSSFAITFLALFIVHFGQSDRIRIAVKHGWMMIIGILFGSAVFIYKHLYIAIKMGEWSYIQDLISSSDFMQIALVQSEPFMTQSILNEVVKHDFFVGPDHFAGVFVQLVPFSSWFGATHPRFNSLFASELFPAADFGIANNIWAEMYSAGGWLLLILFLLVFLLLLRWGSRWIFLRHPYWRSSSALVFTYFAFYIHRNDLVFQISISRRILLICVVVAILSAIAGSIRWTWSTAAVAGERGIGRGRMVSYRRSPR